MIAKAYLRRVWIAYGHESWDLYADKELGSNRLCVPREERKRVACSLRDAGLTLREIGAAMNLSKDTVHRALEDAVSNETSPESDNVVPLSGKGRGPRKPKPEPATEPEPEPQNLDDQDGDESSEYALIKESELAEVKAQCTPPKIRTTFGSAFNCELIEIDTHGQIVEMLMEKPEFAKKFATLEPQPSEGDRVRVVARQSHRGRIAPRVGPDRGAEPAMGAASADPY